MKANEAPMKIYLDEDESWHLTNPNGDSIEYTRTDAFIEKVARFLENKLYYRVEIQVFGTLIPLLTSKKAFIEDFRDYMKGE